MKDPGPARGSHPPGTFWYYRNRDFNVQGTVFIRPTHELQGEQVVWWNPLLDGEYPKLSEQRKRIKCVAPRGGPSRRTCPTCP
jgi:hypothetical protein